MAQDHVGCVILSLLVFLFPPLYGEGYGAIVGLLAGDTSSIVNGSIFYGEGQSGVVPRPLHRTRDSHQGIRHLHDQRSRRCGGTFAPSLYVGCLTGFLFAYMLNNSGSTRNIQQKLRTYRNGRSDERSHARAAYGHLPHRRTHRSYELFLPLLIVSTIAYGTIKVFEPYSIYTMRLAKRASCSRTTSTRPC